MQAPSEQDTRVLILDLVYIVERRRVKQVANTAVELFGLLYLTGSQIRVLRRPSPRYRTLCIFRVCVTKACDLRHVGTTYGRYFRVAVLLVLAYKRLFSPQYVAAFSEANEEKKVHA